jgi:sec-independent protein translocase protein TatC
MESTEEFSSFWDHFSGLRRTLGRILLVIGLGVCISFYFHQAIIKGLTSPLAQTSFHVPMSDIAEKIETYRLSNRSPLKRNFRLPIGSLGVDHSKGVVRMDDGSYEIPTGGSLNYVMPERKFPQLVVLGPLEGMFVALKTSFWVGLVASSPLWLWIGFQFVSPALKRHEKCLALPFFMLSCALVLAGAAFTFYVTIPISNSYLAAFNHEIGINLWSLSHYLDYTLFLLLANGLAFELGAIGLMAVHLGLVGTAWLSNKRRTAIVLAFIVAALLTPPDVLTQLMMAVPLIVFYEAIILYARMYHR